MNVMLVVGIIACITLPVYAIAEEGDGPTMLEMHKKITEGLIGFRKEYPDSQPKVYALLDNVNKLFNTAKTAIQKGAGVKKLLQDKMTENSLLKNELAQLKGAVDTTKKTLEVTQSDLYKKLEEEQAIVQRLTMERKELLNKMAHLEEIEKDQLTKKKQESQVAALETAVAKVVASRS